MASETERDLQQASDFASEFSSLFERFLRRRDLSLLFPFVLGFNTPNSTAGESPENTRDPDHETSQATNPVGDRVILINPFTQSMVVIEGNRSLESLLQSMAAKDGHPPATKASIEAMPSVEISEEEDSECVICLEDWEIVDDKRVAKEMPCKHKFHEKCIKKWLELHGSCPVCRYSMPVDETEIGKKRDDIDQEERRGEIWVSFSFNRRNQNSGNNTQTASSESNDAHHSSD